jgi:integrase
LDVFRVTNCHNLKQQHIRVYMDKRGKASKHRANRELAWLSNVFSHAFERGMMPHNPCKGVKKFAEDARGMYVTDEMYLAMYEAAPLIVRIAMEVAYCTGIRPTDVLTLQWTQVKPDGIHLTTSKTKQRIIKDITPRLRAALDLAKTVEASSFYVVPTRKGTPYDLGSFRSAWRRAQADIPEDMRFQFRDLRSKAITDFEGEKRQFSAHKTEAMVERYNRKPDKSPSH